MTHAELKRLRELSEAKHLDGCSGFGKRCKACEFNSIARLAVPKLLGEVERLGQENVGFGIALNDLSDGCLAAEKERNEARAEVKRLRAELHAARIAEPDSEAYREAVRNWRDVNDQLDWARAALVDICAKIGGRPEGDKLDDYAVYAIERAHKALSE
jgi:hypothetical protein